MSAIFYISYALVWALMVFQSVVLLGVVKTVYRTRADDPVSGALIRSDGALVGHPVPSFTAVDVDGRIINESSLPPSLNALLFVTPDCVTCVASLEEVDALREKVNGNLIVVCRGGANECRDLLETYGLDEIPVIVDNDRELSEAFDVHVTPTAVLIGANGRISTYGHPMDKDDFARLLAEGNVIRSYQEVL
jgi:peroxiredoxin